MLPPTQIHHFYRDESKENKLENLRVSLDAQWCADKFFSILLEILLTETHKPLRLTCHRVINHQTHYVP